MNLDFFTTIMPLGFSQGLILALVLAKSVESNKLANRYLAVLLVFLSILLLSKMIWIKYPSVLLFQRLSLTDPIVFLFGPMLYRYLILLLKEPLLNKNKVLAYVPAMAYLGYMIYTNLIPLERYNDLLKQGDFEIPFLIVELAALAHTSYFWVLCRNKIAKYGRQEKNQFSFDQPAIKFAKFSNYLIGSILLFWWIGFIGTYLVGIDSFAVSYIIVWMALPLLVYVIGYYAIRQPEIFKLSKLKEIPQKKLVKRTYLRLPGPEIINLKIKLEELLEQEKLYLDNELTLATMAKKLGTSPNNLSWLLNKIYESSFYDFINELRIKEFIKKVENKEHLNKTLLALSMDVGFNSKSTFNKSFKTFQRETPTSFIRRKTSLK